MQKDDWKIDKCLMGGFVLDALDERVDDEEVCVFTGGKDKGFEIGGFEECFPEQAGVREVGDVIGVGEGDFDDFGHLLSS